MATHHEKSTFQKFYQATFRQAAKLENKINHSISTINEETLLLASVFLVISLALYYFIIIYAPSFFSDNNSELSENNIEDKDPYAPAIKLLNDIGFCVDEKNLDIVEGIQSMRFKKCPSVDLYFLWEIIGVSFYKMGTVMNVGGAYKLLPSCDTSRAFKEACKIINRTTTALKNKNVPQVLCNGATILHKIKPDHPHIMFAVAGACPVAYGTHFNVLLDPKPGDVIDLRPSPENPLVVNPDENELIFFPHQWKLKKSFTNTDKSRSNFVFAKLWDNFGNTLLLDTNQIERLQRHHLAKKNIKNIFKKFSGSELFISGHYAIQDTRLPTQVLHEYRYGIITATDISDPEMTYLRFEKLPFLQKAQTRQILFLLQRLSHYIENPTITMPWKTVTFYERNINKKK